MATILTKKPLKNKYLIEKGRVRMGLPWLSLSYPTDVRGGENILKTK
jgi:hypothetical protein